MLDLDDGIGQRHAGVKNAKTHGTSAVAAGLTGAGCAVDRSTHILGGGEKATKLALEADTPNVRALRANLRRLLDDGIEYLMVVPKLAKIRVTRPETLVIGGDSASDRGLRLAAAPGDEIAAVTGQREHLITVLRARAAGTSGRLHGSRANDSLALQAREHTVGGKGMAVEARIHERATPCDAKDTESLKDQRLAIRTRDANGVLITIGATPLSGNGTVEGADTLIPRDLRNGRGTGARGERAANLGGLANRSTRTAWRRRTRRRRRSRRVRAPGDLPNRFGGRHAIGDGKDAPHGGKG